MSDVELRKLQAVLDGLPEVNENRKHAARCSKDRDGIVYCARKEFKRSGDIKEGGFAAGKDEGNTLTYIETLGEKDIRKKIIRDLGKNTLR